MQLMFLSMSARLTKELGMAPGGEFRVAVREVRIHTTTIPSLNTYIKGVFAAKVLSIAM